MIRWQHEDGTPAIDVPGLRYVRLDGSLVFQPFRADQYRQDVHAATYRCTATNTFGTLASRDVYVGAGKIFITKSLHIGIKNIHSINFFLFCFN